MADEDIQWLLKNEYATVKVTVDTQGKGTRLKLEDASTGASIYLDPIELQALAWATHEDLSQFARPYFKERAMDRLAGRNPGEAVVDEAETIAREERDE